jgi:hypothetical protein
VFSVTQRHHNADIVVEFTVVLTTPEFTGRAEASTYIVGSPSVLFRSMVESWKGWSGTMQWTDLGAGVTLTASSDSTGHVTVAVELRGGPDFKTRLNANLNYEAGQLDEMARQLQSALG